MSWIQFLKGKASVVLGVAEDARRARLEKALVSWGMDVISVRDGKELSQALSLAFRNGPHPVAVIVEAELPATSLASSLGVVEAWGWPSEIIILTRDEAPRELLRVASAVIHPLAIGELEVLLTRATQSAFSA